MQNSKNLKNLKVTGSRKNIMQSEYYAIIADLLNSEEIQKLKNYQHHITTTRFQHCLNVSYYHYKICRFFKLDANSGARAGLLHDLYFYDTKNYISHKPAIKHSKYHSQTALINAEKIIKLNDRERDMIYNHMWPVTPEKPKYAETYLITFVDKYCAMIEFILPQPKNLINFFKNHCRKNCKKVLDK